jgi:hypothetical protein
LAFQSSVLASAVLASFATDLVSVRMVQFVKDAQRLLPGLAGLPLLAEGVARVGQVGKDRCFVVPIAELLEDAERSLVAGDRFGEVVQGICQAGRD